MTYRSLWPIPTKLCAFGVTPGHRLTCCHYSSSLEFILPRIPVSSLGWEYSMSSSLDEATRTSQAGKPQPCQGQRAIPHSMPRTTSDSSRLKPRAIISWHLATLWLSCSPPQAGRIAVAPKAAQLGIPPGCFCLLTLGWDSASTVELRGLEMTWKLPFEVSFLVWMCKHGCESSPGISAYHRSLGHFTCMIDRWQLKMAPDLVLLTPCKISLTSQVFGNPFSIVLLCSHTVPWNLHASDSCKFRSALIV